MALTLHDLLELTKDQYQLKLLAAEDTLEHVITWAHLMEDTEITRMFWGNEVVITTGYALKTEYDMIHMIDVLERSRCSSVIINTGKYVKKIPQSVIDHCEKKHFPLIVMPWKMSCTEFVRDCCSLIGESSREEDKLADDLLHIMMSPQDIDSKREYIDEHFQEENGLQIISLRPDRIKPLGNITDQRRALRIHSALRPFHFPYSVIRYEKVFLILINQNDPAVTESVAKRVVRNIRTVYSNLPVYVGISEIATSYYDLPDCFHGAISASRRAKLQKTPIVYFEDMGFYKLLYSVPNDALLLKYYHEVMDPLLNYDPENSAVYSETLFRYLLNDGHLKDVADQMFVHRNTVNYRMGKIREILDKDFSRQKDRTPFLMAYHIGVILKINPDYENS